MPSTHGPSEEGKDFQRVVEYARVHTPIHRKVWLPCPAPAHSRRFVSSGFLLPLASLTALALMLSSLSLLSLALQGRLRLAAEQQLLQSEDLVASIAQDLVARVQLNHECLLFRPLGRWMDGGCASPTELASLQTGIFQDQRWQLVRWEPDPSRTASSAATAMDLQVELQPRGSSPALRAAFSLRLTGEPAQVTDLRLLGWVGRA